MARREGETKAEWLAREITRAVGAGKPCDLETVDFSDPNRPPTCLEVDFPIIPVNEIAAVEGNAMKPVYQLGKWWAWRRSAIFRSLLLAAAMRAPEDPSEAAKAVWKAYYSNHQTKGALSQLRVADIFMGGGTTVVEGSRLGMQMLGVDLNPISWFVSCQRNTQVSAADVGVLLDFIDTAVKSEIAPFYAYPCPRGHVGRWTQVSSGEVQGEEFDARRLSPEQRRDYTYAGPEVIYVFWAKHGPCQVTGCGHRTPIMKTPVMAVKTLSVKYWSRRCGACGDDYDLEERDVRMAPSSPLSVADTERPFAVARLGRLSEAPESAVCPRCGETEVFGILPKPKKKKVELSLLVHPHWLRGESCRDAAGSEFGGSVDSSVDATIRWNEARASSSRLLEVRGKLPDEVTCPETRVTFKSGKGGGTVPKRSSYACGDCGTVQDVLETVRETQTTGPVAMYATQGYCLECDEDRQVYGGRFFAPVDDSTSFDLALREWERRKEADLAEFWPRSELPFGFMTHMNNGGIPNHGFTHWWKMFNPRQLLGHALLGKALADYGIERPETLFVAASFQQFLRNQCMFSMWHRARDHFAPALSNSNYHPKDTSIEVGSFSAKGYGPWPSTVGNLEAAANWLSNPWELVYNERLVEQEPELGGSVSGKTEKVYPGDAPVGGATLLCGSSTELEDLDAASFDLVVTDPPFGGLLHYSELSDFFYVWLRLLLRKQHPEYFSGEYTPKTLEAVANRARQPDDSDAFYQRLLTACWSEANRILKPGGLLAFTFHHSEDAPWVSVLESLFDAGFYLEATYPLRGDETKGQGSKPGTFGSQKIEYDIIHVCRKRTEEPSPISWAKMRRRVLQDVTRLQELLEHHSKEGLLDADLQVIRRGKALEYFSRHYGKVYKDEGVPISVQEALVGINQLLDEEAGGVKEPPPHNAEPFTRMFLRLFDGNAELARDQMQKFLRGTGTAPSDFIGRGWCFERRKVFHLTPPLELARKWQGKHRRGMTSDYDQAAFLIGACHEASGINAGETLGNQNFKPHPALGALLTWHKSHGATNEIRNAASIAAHLYRTWESKNQSQNLHQLQLFFSGEDE